MLLMAKNIIIIMCLFAYGCRGNCLEYVDVLCYRDYTREGRRVNSHSLVIKNVKLTKFGSLNGTSCMKREMLLSVKHFFKTASLCGLVEGSRLKTGRDREYRAMSSVCKGLHYVEE
jgi:hypothetical protein